VSTAFPGTGIQTTAVHAGEKPDPHTGASSPNIVMSSTYMADASAGFSVELLDEEAPFVYSRWGNPTVDQLERKLAALENAETAVAFASGMAAASALFLYLLRPGDRMVISDVSYAGVAELGAYFLPQFGVEVIRVDMSDLDAVDAALQKPARLVYAETPCNPILRLTDIAAVAAMSRRAGAKLAVDSTFSTPIATRPLDLGADFVLHSLTKYMCGHGDAIGGALLGSRADMAGIRREIAIRVGGVISPFNAWLIMRGMATLPIRMAAHEKGALHVARFLETHPRVSHVVYPGLPSHPQHDLARRQMDNFSGMVAFRAENGPQTAERLCKHLKIIHYAVSLGHHRSLLFYLRTDDMLKTSFKLDPVQSQSYREYAGEGLFRLSVGLEDPKDLCRDLDQALLADG